MSTAALAAPSLVCPACEDSVESGFQCPSCDIDLRSLAILNGVGDHYYNEGIALANSGGLDEAAVHLRAAVSLDPDDIEARVVLGKVLAQVGARDEALSELEEALARENGNLLALRVRALRAAAQVQQERLVRGAIVWVGAPLIALAIVAAVVVTLVLRGGDAGPDLQGARDALGRSDVLRNLPLTLSAQRDSLIIEGRVDNDTQRELVRAVVASFANDIDVSGVVRSVEPPPPAGLNLAEAVHAALAADSRTAGLKLHVTQVGDGVRINGAVARPADRQSVEIVASSVRDVVLVDTTGIDVTYRQQQEYVVAPGDSLFSIAARFYGDSSQWELVFAANSGNVTDAHIIHPGQVLTIPELPGPEPEGP